MNNNIPCAWISEQTKREEWRSQQNSSDIFLLLNQSDRSRGSCPSGASPPLLVSLLGNVSQSQLFLLEIAFCQVFGYNIEKSNWQRWKHPFISLIFWSCLWLNKSPLCRHAILYLCVHLLLSIFFFTVNNAENVNMQASVVCRLTRIDLFSLYNLIHYFFLLMKKTINLRNILDCGLAQSVSTWFQSPDLQIYKNKIK